MNKWGFTPSGLTARNSRHTAGKEGKSSPMEMQVAKFSWGGLQRTLTGAVGSTQQQHITVPSSKGGLYVTAQLNRA